MVLRNIGKSRPPSGTCTIMSQGGVPEGYVTSGSTPVFPKRPSIHEPRQYNDYGGNLPDPPCRRSGLRMVSPLNSLQEESPSYLQGYVP